MDHDCSPGCDGQPVRWSDRTGHWYCEQGNDACHQQRRSNERILNLLAALFVLGAAIGLAVLLSVWFIR